MCTHVRCAQGASSRLVRTFMQPELAGPGARLLEISPDPAFAVRIGQFRTPFTRAFVTAILLLSFPDRGVIANTFLAGRDTGITVFGTPLDAVIEYYVGVFNGSGINGRIGDTPMPMFVGRFVVTPIGRMPYNQTPSLDADDVGGLSFGINGYYRENDVDVMGMGVAQETAAAGGDVAVALGPFYFQAEGFFQAQRLAAVTSWTSAWGAYAQAGLFVLPRIVEVSARAGWADADIDAAGGLVQSYEAAVSGYFALHDEHYGQHLKLILNYRFADNEGPATFGDALPASSHRVIAHIQIWF